ncbi:MAG: hypothetical protein ABF572_04575 [Gluconobacter sp.]|uniref:hypothetical protein n=1 Tax=Gluconobacter sp. TaxID=1876758 RepID=UPI0039E9401A
MSGRTDADLFAWLRDIPAHEVRPERQDAIREAVNAAMDDWEKDRAAMDAEERG